MTPDFSTLWLRLDVRAGITDDELREMVAGTGAGGPESSPAFLLAVMHPENGATHVHRAALQLQGSRLVAALEEGWFGDLEDRLRERLTSDAAPPSAARLLSALLHLFLEDLEAALRRARNALGQSQSEVRALISRLDADKAAGVADLPGLSTALLNVTDMLAMASRSLEGQSCAARWLRRQVAGADAKLAAELEDLIAAQEQASRFIEFLFQKQRLLEGLSSQSVAMSDLNVTKIFTVLWTIFIPGTAIINWYGQNFQFMPELSWYYSLWVQLGTAFLLTVIPVYVVMRSGALR